ncbi:MAG: phosphoribosylanthranilate isomerase [Hyphomicrobiales bacterium]
MTDVKICGLSTRTTMQAALEAGADYVGLMFYPPSPRNISIEEAVPLADMARGKAKIVAVTVDADDALVGAIAKHVRPDYIQCHGSEGPERIAEIAALSGCKTIKALKIRGAEDLVDAGDYAQTAALLLYDAKVPEGFKNPLPGGNGVQFDWRLLGGQKNTNPFMLGGGIDITNVADAIAIAHPAIIDVSSGVETSPGHKDEVLIGEFVARAKAGSASMGVDET